MVFSASFIFFCNIEWHTALPHVREKKRKRRKFHSATAVSGGLSHIREYYSWIKNNLFRTSTTAHKRYQVCRLHGRILLFEIQHPSGQMRRVEIRQRQCIKAPWGNAKRKYIEPPQTFAQHKYVPSLLECTNHRKVQKLNKPDNTPRVAAEIYNTTYKNIMVHVRRSKLQIPCSSEIKLPHASESSIKYRLYSASGEPGPHVIFPTIFFFFYRAWSSRPEALCLLVDSSRPRSESSRTCHCPCGIA